jgi:hypothetical protein
MLAPPVILWCAFEIVWWRERRQESQRDKPTDRPGD